MQVTLENCGQVIGPFFHGTTAVLAPGDEIRPGFASNFHPGRVMNHVFFAAGLEAAVWGAELACALSGGERAGRIYVVQPTGPFEDDPNVTDKKFPGNPTRSYRSRHPLHIVEEIVEWEGHSPEVLDKMLQSLARLREQGLDVIED